MYAIAFKSSGATADADAGCWLLNVFDVVVVLLLVVVLAALLLLLVVVVEPDDVDVVVLLAYSLGESSVAEQSDAAAVDWALSSSLMRLETCDLACLRRWSLR